MMKLLKPLLLILFLSTPVYGQDSGFFVRSDCDTLSPENDRTICQQFATAGERSPGLYEFTGGAWSLVGAGAAGSPGGADTQVQFNDGGSFGGDAGLTYNKTTNVLTVSGGVTGEASTATALAANGANCTAGNFPLGVDASGAAETCTDAATQAELNTHEAAADPHTGYRLESADHTHASTGAQAGQLDHGLALTGLTDDDHTQYALETAVQDGTLTYCLDAGSTDTYVCSTGLTAYKDGMVVNFEPNTDNTGAATINIDSLGAKSITKSDGVTDPDDSGLAAGTPYLLTYDGTVFRMQQDSGGTTPSWDATFDVGKEVDGASSEADCAKISNGTAGWCIFAAGDNIPRLKGYNGASDVDSRQYIETNMTGGLYDVEGASDIETNDPDAASPNAMWTYFSGYRPLKTVYLGADSLYVIGAATLTTDTALISGGEVAPYITVTDVDTDGFQRSFRMPGSWDGGTVTATVSLLSVHATPADNFEVDVSGECWGNSDVRTTIDTTGEQAANFDFDASGTCGASACVTNETLQVTTAAITLNGSPAAGAICGFQALVDATATTTTLISSIKITDMNIHYSVDSRSD